MSLLLVLVRFRFFWMIGIIEGSVGCVLGVVGELILVFRIEKRGFLFGYMCNSWFWVVRWVSI